jgi:4-hydroxybenzoate polyprenyltransferase
MDAIGALMKLTRIEHSAMLVVAVLAAELISGGLPPLGTLLLSLISPIFISMSAFAINDYFDVEADRANSRMDRPIVRGAVSKRDALSIALICAVVGVLLSIFINASAFAIALVFAVLSFLYSYKLKDMLAVGNAYVALSMVIPFVYGSYIASASISANIALICIIIFLAGLGREVQGAIRDYKGDTRARRVKNIVHHMGLRRSSYLVVVLYLFAIVLNLFMLSFNLPFLRNLVYAVMIIPADIALLGVSFMGLTYYDSSRFLRSARNLTLGAITLALFAYLLAALLYIPL